MDWEQPRKPQYTTKLYCIEELISNAKNKNFKQKSLQIFFIKVAKVRAYTKEKSSITLLYSDSRQTY